MNNLGYLVAAYAVVWAALFFYLWRLNSLCRTVEDDVARLESRLGTESDNSATA
jgi:hypothetical protein